MTVIMNGKEFTEQEYHEWLAKENKKKITEFVKSTNTDFWIEFDGKFFEDIFLLEEFIEFNHYAPISNSDIVYYRPNEVIEAVSSIAYIITWRDWEAEEEEEEDYNDYEIEASLMNACIREAYGLL